MSTALAMLDRALDFLNAADVASLPLDIGAATDTIPAHLRLSDAQDGPGTPVGTAAEQVGTP